MSSLVHRTLIVSVALIEIAVLAALALLPAAPAHAQDATGQIAFTRGSFDSSDIYVMNGDGSSQTNLTNSSAVDRGPAWSPDGTKIAFTTDRDGNGEIYVMNADGSGLTNLTNNPANDSIAAWLPDGNRIAFLSDRSGEFPSGYVMDADGSNPAPLLSDVLSPGAVGTSDWSPDGSRIVFVEEVAIGGDPAAPNIRPNIQVSNADGSGVTQLTPTDTYENFDPTWSSDASRIAYISSFASLPDYGYDVFLMNADGSDKVNLTSSSELNIRPGGLAWSPDGDRLAFSSGSFIDSDIYLINADGSGLTRLTDDLAADSGAVWSPLQVAEPTPTVAAAPTDEPPEPGPSATGQIAFTSDRDGNDEIYVMNADGSGQTNLTNNPANDSEPAWSPDGSRIAFATNRHEPAASSCFGCNFDIYLVDADGTDQTRVTFSSRKDFEPHWSPDGTQIAFVTDRDEPNAGCAFCNHEIYVADADGTNETRLTNNDAEDGWLGFDWSPDGTRIVFSTVRSASLFIYMMNADGSGQTQLTDEGTFPVWSPDGSRIAFTSGRDGNGEIYVMNTDGSGLINLTNNPASDFEATWSPDGSKIAFSSDRDGNGEIYVMNADGSGQTNLTNSPANDTSPAWSPLQVAEPTPTTAPAEPTPAGPPQSEFVRSVPGPGDISTDPGVVSTNIIFTLVVIFVFGFTSALFNETVSNNRKDIEGWVGRFFRPFRRLSGLVEQQYGAVAGGRPWVQRLAGPAVILLITGLVYGYLSSDFDIDSQSAVLVVSMILAVGAATYVYAGGEALFTRRVLGLDAGVKLYAIAVVIAVGFVLFSRLVEFRPGFMFGFVASFTLLTPAALDRERSGQAALFPAVALLFVSLIAWVLLVPLRELESTNSWAGLPEGTAAALVVAGLEGVFFSMIPLSFMHGARIAQWNRLLWLLMFALTGFLFWHVLLNQEGDFLEAFEETKIRVIVALLSSYFVATLAFWAYFRGRVYGWSLPALLRGQSTAEPGLRQPVPLPMFLAVIAVAVTAVIALGVLAVVSTGGGDDDSSVVVGESTPTVTALPSAAPATPTIAATPTVSVAIDRSTCGQPSNLPALTQELATVRNQGYIVCDTSTYLPGGAIHVLIGVLENSSDSFTQLAFFFVGGEYLGTDSITPSASITVVSQVSNTVTLSYAMYRPDDPSCCPSADEAVVPYDWNGTRLMPRVDIPATDGPVSRR